MGAAQASLPGAHPSRPPDPSAPRDAARGCWGHGTGHSHGSWAWPSNCPCAEERKEKVLRVPEGPPAPLAGAHPCCHSTHLQGSWRWGGPAPPHHLSAPPCPRSCGGGEGKARCQQQAPGLDPEGCSPARLRAAGCVPSSPPPRLISTYLMVPLPSPGCRRGLQQGLGSPRHHHLSATHESGEPACQHACLLPHVPAHTVVVLGGCCAGGDAAPEPPCCQCCPSGLGLSLLPFTVATAPVPPSTMPPTSPTNTDPAVHHPGVVTLLEAAVTLPTGLGASSSPCRRPAQAGPAPVPPLALLSPQGVCSLSPPPGTPSPANWGSAGEPQQYQPWHHPTLPPAEFLPPAQPVTRLSCSQITVCTHGSSQCCTLALGQGHGPQPTRGTSNTPHTLHLPW